MKRAAITLAVDAHGGDHGPEVMVGAALDAVAEDPGIEIALVGIPSDLQPWLPASLPPRLRVVPSECALQADARPVSVLRTGTASSLGRAMELVGGGAADAVVSAGSTVALMALGVKMLGRLPGIRRPALMSRIPAANGFTSMLDLGANLAVDASHLVQFAIMGVVMHGRRDAPPSVGLLNVGHEESKGHAVVQAAHEYLLELPLNYHGFIEGNDIFAGRVDVAVCDGFAGNLILKSSEGLARMLFSELRRSLRGRTRARLGAWLAAPAVRDVLERYDPAQHNGAPLLGLRNVVVKSHGSANRPATLQALREAGSEARREVPMHIGELISSYGADSIQ